MQHEQRFWNHWDFFGKQQPSSVGSPGWFCNAASFWVGWDKPRVGGWNLILEEETWRNRLFQRYLVFRDGIFDFCFTWKSSKRAGGEELHGLQKEARNPKLWEEEEEYLGWFCCYFKWWAWVADLIPLNFLSGREFQQPNICSCHYLMWLIKPSIKISWRETIKHVKLQVHLTKQRPLIKI